MKTKIRIVRKAPRSIASQYWPGRGDTSIRKAVTWFHEHFHRLPEVIEAASDDLDEEQRSIRMWARNLPDPCTLTF
jgi:hypothetical protein